MRNQRAASTRLRIVWISSRLRSMRATILRPALLFWAMPLCMVLTSAKYLSINGKYLASSWLIPVALAFVVMTKA